MALPWPLKAKARGFETVGFQKPCTGNLVCQWCLEAKCLVRGLRILTLSQPPPHLPSSVKFDSGPFPEPLDKLLLKPSVGIKDKAVSKTEDSGPCVAGLGTSWLTRRGPAWEEGSRSNSYYVSPGKAARHILWGKENRGLRACYMDMVKSSIFKKKKTPTINLPLISHTPLSCAPSSSSHSCSFPSWQRSPAAEHLPSSLSLLSLLMPTPWLPPRQLVHCSCPSWSLPSVAATLPYLLDQRCPKCVSADPSYAHFLKAGNGQILWETSHLLLRPKDLHSY